MSLQRMYQRYGGLCQTHPLTEEDQLYDRTCQGIDYAEQQLKTKSAALFTVGELLWFNWFTNKMFVTPNQKQLDTQFLEIGTLLKVIQEREKKVTA
jgi:hypothetical protein